LSVVIFIILFNTPPNRVINPCSSNSAPSKWAAAACRRVVGSVLCDKARRAIRERFRTAAGIETVPRLASGAEGVGIYLLEGTLDGAIPPPARIAVEAHGRIPALQHRLAHPGCVQPLTSSTRVDAKVPANAPLALAEGAPGNASIHSAICGATTRGHAQVRDKQWQLGPAPLCAARPHPEIACAGKWSRRFASAATGSALPLVRCIRF